MEQTLKDLIAINPPLLTEPVNTVIKLLETKHWFELGKSLINLLNQPAIVGERNNLYQQCIKFFADYLDPMHHAQIIYLVSQEFSAPDAALDFLKKSLSLFSSHQNASDWLSLQMVSQYIINGDFETSLQLTNEIENRISYSSPMIVRSLFYRVQSTLDKANGDNDTFYEHALMYLSTSRSYNDVVLAYDLCYAGLVSKNVCSFGELADHPIVQILVNTENEWMYKLVKLLDSGSPTIIDEFNTHYLPIISTKPQFASHVETIKFKVTISVLLQLIFQRPFESRVFSFDEICTVCKIPKNKVEIIVLKALAAEIIKGFIDEVDERVVITWCKPKTLGIIRLQHLKDQIDRWIKRVHEQKVLLDLKAQAIIG